MFGQAWLLARDPILLGKQHTCVYVSSFLCPIPSTLIALVIIFHFSSYFLFNFLSFDHDFVSSVFVSPSISISLFDRISFLLACLISLSCLYFSSLFLFPFASLVYYFSFLVLFSF